MGAWIARDLAAAPPRAKSLVVTVWGDALAPHGGSVWLSGLIRLLAPFGINERLVRTSVFRLAREGWLAARQDGRRSRYRLTRQGLRRFEHAYRRIYAPPSADDWDGSWQMLVAAPAGIEKAARSELRRELGWEGFGALAPGLLVRPARPEGKSPNAGAVEYRTFMRRFQTVVTEFARRDADAEQCFVVRTLLIHAFRRVTLHDPQLPPKLLPARWPGPDAYALCRDFYRLTHKRAEAHLASILHTEGGGFPPAAAYFHQRFGGLRP
ncbi:MAG: phenylacetic acid degradation operon negative regulatory protein PaaX [Betaproteobacteria bacterium]|nr:MAG: phenylacetic acid degradation operon negative regulatory protein PaaX [Betaproteobacteria bacterium]